MKTFTTLITSKIGESRGVARVWLEGHKLLKAGVTIGARYSLKIVDQKARLELVQLMDADGSDPVVTVSKRVRHGITTPLLEIPPDCCGNCSPQPKKSEW